MAMIQNNSIPMIFEDLISQVKTNQSTDSFCISEFWAQGRTVFGGLTAALSYAAMRNSIEPSRLLRSMNCSFVAPIEVGVPIQFEVEILREGKSVSQVLAKILQNGQICVLTQASFGKDRDSRIKVPVQLTPNLVAPDKGTIVLPREGLTPNFLKQFDISVCRGQAPFSNSKLNEIGGWMRFANSDIAATDEHLITLIDIWPSTILQMFNSFAPASSLSWSLEFIHPHPAHEPTSWFAYEAITRQAAHGYAHTEANIWNQKGDLIAISRQAVVAYQ